MPGTRLSGGLAVLRSLGFHETKTPIGSQMPVSLWPVGSPGSTMRVRASLAVWVTRLPRWSTTAGASSK